MTQGEKNSSLALFSILCQKAVPNWNYIYLLFTSLVSWGQVVLKMFVYIGQPGIKKKKERSGKKNQYGNTSEIPGKTFLLTLSGYSQDLQSTKNDGY